MRKTIISIIAITAVTLAGPASAASASKEEKIGIGSGAVVGAAAGGPFGFLIGAAVGAKIGNTMHQKNERIANLQDSVDTSNSTVARLERDIGALDSEIERLQSLARPELISLMQAGIAMDLLFRTDEAVLAESTSDRLSQLATTLSGMRGVHIQLDGFADERGAADYNQALSERRVRFVRDQFLAAGVSLDRISVSAHGESVAEDETADSYALERRVSVRLFIDESPSLAANP
jgi:outer membrane protein OmpA-like peptidoglycan-associated protein